MCLWLLNQCRSSSVFLRVSFWKECYVSRCQIGPHCGMAILPNFQGGAIHSRNLLAILTHSMEMDSWIAGMDSGIDSQWKLLSICCPLEICFTLGQVVPLLASPPVPQSRRRLGVRPTNWSSFVYGYMIYYINKDHQLYRFNGLLYINHIPGARTSKQINLIKFVWSQKL